MVSAARSLSRDRKAESPLGRGGYLVSPKWVSVFLGGESQEKVRYLAQGKESQRAIKDSIQHKRRPWTHGTNFLVRPPAGIAGPVA